MTTPVIGTRYYSRPKGTIVIEVYEIRATEVLSRVVDIEGHFGAYITDSFERFAELWTMEPLP